MSVLVLAEHNNKDIKSSTLSTISAASQIDEEIHVLVIGFQCEELAEKISKCEKVWQRTLLFLIFCCCWPLFVWEGKR